MRKYTFICFFAVLLIGSLILADLSCIESTAAFLQPSANESVYEPGDIIICVYDIECKKGIGGYTLDMKYDGDNFDFFRAHASGNYSVVDNDNSVGTVKIGVLENNVHNDSEYAVKVRTVVSFTTLYTLDPTYITFNGKVTSFTDHLANKTDTYNVTESFFLFNSSYDNYSECIEKLLEISDSDTDTNSDIHEKNSDTDTNSDIHEKNSDTDTNSDIHEKNSDTDTNSDIHEKNSDTDTNSDIHEKNSDTDTNSDIHEKNSDTDTNTDDHDKENFLYGDVDFSGELTAGDALLVLRGSVNLESFDKTAALLADVDCDGKITSADSLDVLRASVGLEVNSKAGKILRACLIS